MMHKIVTNNSILPATMFDTLTAATTETRRFVALPIGEFEFTQVYATIFMQFRHSQRNLRVIEVL